VTPHATLTQIGKLGLGFERFPEFQNWFRDLTAERHLVIIGYSASDSFDVVPLLEHESPSSTVTWFSYEPRSRKLRLKKISSSRNCTPFPTSRSIDFVANTLDRIASRQESRGRVYRVFAGSLPTFLQSSVRLKKSQLISAPDGLPSGPRNLRALQPMLTENPLTALQRRAILRLLDDGLFGESYATDVEQRPVRRGQHVRFEESRVRFRRGTVERRADVAFKRGLPDRALRLMEDSALRSADADQLLLLLHHFEFRLGEQHADLNRLKRAIRKTERVSKRSGLLWGLIMAEWMKSFRLEAVAKQRPRTRQTAREQALAILAHSEKTVYFGVRAGWQTWYATCSRLAAKHAVAIQDYDTAEGLLTNLLEWLDRQTPTGIEETAGTACALNTLGIQSRRRRLINAANFVLSALDSRTCPVVELLRVAAEAERAGAKSDWRQVDQLEQLANQLILTVDPADHWNVHGVFSYLRRYQTARTDGS
jgi:hypothetical protein